ncbi:Uncharacterized protein SCF082_LOCUS19343 [Durusdinium trenchii]|uniref:Uncharacterized protein n=1 Tax=Durusdinium trenchii TaxID=1381693 RepID=A0ABP0KV60_9DINO
MVLQRPCGRSLAYQALRSRSWDPARFAHGFHTEDDAEESLSDQLEKLLAKYEDTETMQDTSTQSTGVNEIPPDLTGELAALQEHCSACDALEEKVSSLVPCLHGDYPTTRLVVALAAMEMGQDLARHGELPGPFQSLSSADVCWGLVSEKRRLVLETLLGSGPVSWPELRCSNVAYWLGTRQAQSLELVEFLLTRLVQSSLAKLRSNTQGGSLEMSDAQAEARSNSRRQNIDEAVFWSVVLGSNVTKLRALLRTGLLRESQTGGLAVLLQHERVGEPDFLRKNAFRLLELHRFHLSAALFLLSGIEDDDDTDSDEEEEEKETWSWVDSERGSRERDKRRLHFMPHGYGHRMVSMVQVRYALQPSAQWSSILPEMRTDLDKDAGKPRAANPALYRQYFLVGAKNISDNKNTTSVLDREWHLTSPVDLQPRHLNRSSRCEFEAWLAADAGLGNGKNWSQWSHSSKPFIFQVPPPVVPTAASLKAQRTVNVEAVTEEVWGDFKPAPGLTMLEYEAGRVSPKTERRCVEAQRLTKWNRFSDWRDALAFPPHWITFEHRYRGGFIEHELFNLLPFTYYIFSVQARYPKVGTRAWCGAPVESPEWTEVLATKSGQQLSHPIILEPAVAYQDPPTPLPVPERAEEENRCDQK